VANDPDVLGAERLFSAWMNGQIAYRGLPGIAVGVVSDQELVWAAGFGHANVADKIPMSPTTKFRMASHSKMFAAIAIMQLREQGKLRLDDPVSTTALVQGEARGRRRRPDHHRATLSHSSGLQREAGDHWTSYEFPTPTSCAAVLGSAGRIRSVGAMEVFEPRVFHRRHGHQR
jgi:CubicO group peptidase (beta-lactamase class C family)